MRERKIEFKALFKHIGITKSIWLHSTVNHVVDSTGYVQCSPWLQYTGLKDKNGKMIFEGDILDFDAKEWGGSFDPESISMDQMKGEWNLCGSVGDVDQWRSIIGSIHDK